LPSCRLSFVRHHRVAVFPLVECHLCKRRVRVVGSSLHELIVCHLLNVGPHASGGVTLLLTATSVDGSHADPGRLSVNLDVDLTVFRVVAIHGSSAMSASSATS